ncbi:hypothetical protein EV356DRAFT_454594 [Viridothelium virens]|uniref:BTB domain-containing protein n=1 Tax=Viridothelium virens TaxID=1048519 RepID=A0A6A6GWG3_VIRVR|nr:hypothetical protein EV356DRAFT_454594 [Viridothelium virens]
MEGTTTSEARDGKEFTTVIVDSGDIRLNICHDLANRNTQTFSYRVDTTCLRRTSRFFDRLLSGQFVEAQRISEGLERLRKQYKNMIEAPISELPSVNIEDVGRVAISKSVQPLMADFLRALHGAGIESKVSIPNMANLVVVADRFDALPYFSEYVRKRKLLRGKDTPEQKLSEERLRQKLYVGILLNHEAWVAPPSHRIITRGSESWKMDSDFINSACWWNLPRGLEEELQYRRECTLDTLSSLQTHFVKLYTSRELQCKLGYDSSPQCDAFQLGEMMRFFSRINLMRVQSTIYDVDTAPQIYTGDIHQLVSTLRQCPSYQINSHHSHCGLRARLTPILDWIEQALTDLAICANCWEHRRDDYAWSKTKRLPVWRRTEHESLRVSGRKGPCVAKHTVMSDMFTAVSRDWTARYDFAEDLHRDHMSSGMKLVR